MALITGPRPLRLVHRALLRRGCPHSIPPSLRTRLVESSSCPSCQITRLIKDIRDVQKGLETRGGIFKSKEKMTVELKNGSMVAILLQVKRHRAWTRKWRETKIKVMTRLCEFEQVMEEMIEAEEFLGVAEVKEALRLWEEVEEEMAVMPGYAYVKGIVETEGEDEIQDESNEGAGGIALVDLKYVAQGTQEKNNYEDEHRVGDTVDIHLSEDKSAQLTGLVGGIHVCDIQNDNETSELRFPKDNKNSPANPVTTAATTPIECSTPTLRPALRTTHTSTSTTRRDSTAPTPLAVQFLEYTTHIPHAQKHILSRPIHPTEQPHNPYTNAETCRPRLVFLRSSEFYHPGTWFSPEGCEKIDTSFMKSDWNVVEKDWDTVEMACEVEMKMPPGLEMGYWLWVMGWWVREVARREKEIGKDCKGGLVVEK
ncbi:hypothetical protein K505DRAFT_339037 [Melanomma pulvis-pyrius CBS 109.77]|uniref:Uncharacterized protein n=1 Tax=Melanomma pulvis-pyrius CBS 109.77 TaxID=1314802 RepID=A0A6A6X801_9PLEO|nr:hypothetical protein K505DRAFT_339037 [Melanomma pulvis-pyrius CBS 109.77]